MLFKRKIPFDKYLTTRLDLLFSPEQTERWLEVKGSCGNDEIARFLRNDIFLTHIRAAHVELRQMVLTKKYFKNLEMMFSIETFIEDYVEKRDGLINSFRHDLYSRALGSGPDGILVMTRVMLDEFCMVPESETLFLFREMFYGTVASFRADFTEVKLVIDAE